MKKLSYVVMLVLMTGLTACQAGIGFSPNASAMIGVSTGAR